MTLCDENVEEIDFDVEADIVGVTGYIIHKERMFEIIREFRRRGRFVVVGGPYASLCPEDLRGQCDVLFVDEAEETWSRFLRDFAAGAWKTEYRASEKPDMRTSPIPRFDLLKVDRYHALTIQFARGCPFNCEFCDIIVVYGRRPRAKSVEQVMGEIRECHRLGAQPGLHRRRQLHRQPEARQGAAAGDGTLGSRERSIPSTSTPRSPSTSRVTTSSSSCCATPTSRRSSSGSRARGRESLAETGKTQNMRGDLVENVRKIHSYGIQVQAGMIVGFDHDDEAIFEEQLRFVQEARIPVSMTGMLQAMPKTPLYERVEKEGRLLNECGGDQFVLSNILPLQMSRSALYRGYRWLVDELYDFQNYKERTLAFLMHRGATRSTAASTSGAATWSGWPRSSGRRWFSAALAAPGSRSHFSGPPWYAGLRCSRRPFPSQSCTRPSTTTWRSSPSSSTTACARSKSKS